MRALVILAAIAGLAACSPETQTMAEGPTIPPGTEVNAPDTPYADAGDAHAEVDAAFAAAQLNDTRVLVNFGGDWCPDCRILAGYMEIPEFAEYLEAHYEVVRVDVGRYDRNMDVAARFGFEELEGVPTIAIATADGRIVNRGTATEWRTARERDPQEALDYFVRYANEDPAEDADRAVTARE